MAPALMIGERGKDLRFGTEANGTSAKSKECGTHETNRRQGKERTRHSYPAQNSAVQEAVETTRPWVPVLDGQGCGAGLSISNRCRGMAGVGRRLVG